MTTGYLKAFGLQEPAFGLTPDPRFFYVTRANQEAFLAVRYGIKLGSGVMVVTGDSGVGKTALMRLVRERSESNTHIGEIAIFSKSDPALLPRMMRVTGSWKVAPDRTAMLRELRRHLIQELMQNRTVAVVIEDAHELSLEQLKELQLVSRLRWDEKNLLQIVLLGRPALEARFEAPELAALRSRIALRYRVKPLSRNEVAPYIEHRLACAGCAQAGVFLPTTVERVAAYSRGTPGVINIICERALIATAAVGRMQVTPEAVERVWRALRHSGETDLEVAALLSEIRSYSYSAAHARHGHQGEPYWSRQPAQFGLDERMQEGGGRFRSRIGDLFYWMGDTRRSEHEGVRSSRYAPRNRLRTLIERVRRAIPSIGFFPDKVPGNARRAGQRSPHY